jgi:hypothetical protein
MDDSFGRIHDRNACRGRRGHQEIAKRSGGSNQNGVIVSQQKDHGLPG